MKTLLIGIDTREDNARLLAQAIGLATAFSSNIYLVHVAEPDPAFMSWEGDSAHDRHERAVIDREDHREVQEAAEYLRSRGYEATALQFRAPTAEGLVAKARDLKADCIIVGSHQRSPLLRALLGSVSHRVIDLSPCPILVVPTP